jgi:hypothetical protein
VGAGGDVEVRFFSYHLIFVVRQSQSFSSPFGRKRHAAAHREQQRQKAAHAAAKAEAARILKAKEDGRRRARDERERRRRVEAREAYRRRWVELLESKPQSADLGFGDIPWPVGGGGVPNISELTAEAISAFLFIPDDEKHGEEQGLEEAGKARTRKEELRGVMLRFHPDKFEGRIIPRVRHEEKAAVREGANAVTRAVTTLLVEK